MHTPFHFLNAKLCERKGDEKGMGVAFSRVSTYVKIPITFCWLISISRSLRSITRFVHTDKAAFAVRCKMAVRAEDRLWEGDNILSLFSVEFPVQQACPFAGVLLAGASLMKYISMSKTKSLCTYQWNILVASLPPNPSTSSPASLPQACRSRFSRTAWQ